MARIYVSLIQEKTRRFDAATLNRGSEAGTAKASDRQLLLSCMLASKF